MCVFVYVKQTFMVGIIMRQDYMCTCWDRFSLQYLSDSWCFDSSAFFWRPWTVKYCEPSGNIEVLRIILSFLLARSLLISGLKTCMAMACYKPSRATYRHQDRELHLAFEWECEPLQGLGYMQKAQFPRTAIVC